MDTIRLFYLSLLDKFDPQLHFLQEKARSLNQQLSSTYSPLQLVTTTALVTTCVIGVYRFIFIHEEDLVIRLRETVFRLARRLPVVQRQIAKAREDTLTSVCNDIATSIAGHKFIQSLPTQGLSKKKLLEKLEQYRNFEKINFQDGQVSGCVYKIPRTDMTDIYQQIFILFGDSNPLHVDVFPDIRTMEAEVVRCVATMFHGNESVCGTMTSGGTESLIMACKTYRDLAYSKGISKPEM
ncbi:unnamed protein product [Adineta ricciae]|uniref:Uncharacterized protein n=1 Tax=Adineta ricciae TaxID=249248 RepID=A0A814DHG1_ADIRI|nr:unnamed protein product [Adineta ricciae]CAF1572886.1 unnamed protein product [Adineta ricciae]